MRKVFAVILAVCVCFGLCACEKEDKSNKANVSSEQADAIEKSARVRGMFEYGYYFDSITFDTKEESGMRTTISGTITYTDNADDNTNKFYGDYTTTIIESNDVEQPYTRDSWKFSGLRDANGKPIDFFRELYDYIVRVGEYDTSSNRYYVYDQEAANHYIHLITEPNDELQLWDFVLYESSNRKFLMSYECYFKRGEKPYFQFQYIDSDDVYNGYVLDGITANVTGYFDVFTNEIQFSLQNISGCTLDDIEELVLSEIATGRNFIRDIKENAGIQCSYEYIFTQE